MTPAIVSAQDISEATGLSLTWCKQKLTDASSGPPMNIWRRVQVRTLKRDGEVFAVFTSLPVEFREAFVMRDQQELPLPEVGAK